MRRTRGVGAIGTMAFVVAVLVGAHMSCRGEDKRRLPPVSSSRLAPPPTAWREYADGLMTAASEQKKWEVTASYLRSQAKGQEVSAPDKARGALLQLRRASANWLAYYPEITRRLTLTPQDLETLSESLESENVYIWEETIGDAHAHYRLTRTTGENAQGWLLHLTGVTFRNESAFRSWLLKSQAHLTWNPKTGRFTVARGNPKAPK